MLFDFVLVTFVVCMGAAWFSMHERLICQPVSKNTSLQLEEKLEHEGWDSLEADGWAVLGSEWEQYHLHQNDYSFDALQTYCFGINIKL